MVRELFVLRNVCVALGTVKVKEVNKQFCISKVTLDKLMFSH